MGEKNEIFVEFNVRKVIFNLAIFSTEKYFKWLCSLQQNKEADLNNEQNNNCLTK